MDSTNINIVIAGASGYIGQAIIPQILERFQSATVFALSRSKMSTLHPRLTWRECDLFSLKSIEEALPEKVDCAIYLVHSMVPTAALDQGSFADYDLILADNFARVLKLRNNKHIIYLGGLIPEQEDLSLHLQSRLEVEQVFKEHNLPLTIFRAGLIVGTQGSSFQIMLKLVQRLPVMVCPKWTQNLTSPVDLKTVVQSITRIILKKEHVGKTYDLAACEPLSYLEMMQQTASHMNKRKLFIRFPYLTPRLSSLWVSLVTQSSKNLVYPLIESLKYSMVTRPDKELKGLTKQRYLDILKNLDLSLKKSKSFFRFKPQRKTVRSVQRLPLPKNKDAYWIKKRYFLWLKHVLKPLVDIVYISQQSIFKFKLFKLTILTLKLNKHRSHKDRQLLYINKGILVAEKNRGRLEFRTVLNNRYVLAAIHDYKPSLPWFIYTLTQAKVHALVMKCFANHLRKKLNTKMKSH
ncbi:NAD-dependent epimerase/dehydratase family protein [bacterium]|nr:NAD-dependent epimerase/dehydratase family protein [bacterium]